MVLWLSRETGVEFSPFKSPPGVKVPPGIRVTIDGAVELDQDKPTATMANFVKVKKWIYGI
jgi:hypothetical protein